MAALESPAMLEELRGAPPASRPASGSLKRALFQGSPSPSPAPPALRAACHFGCLPAELLLAILQLLPSSDLCQAGSPSHFAFPPKPAAPGLGRRRGRPAAAAS